MATLASVIGRGLHSARPAAGTAGQLYYETDTTTLFRDNGSSWDSVEGTASGGYTQGARAYNSGNLTISNNTVTALTLNSERYDTDTIHDTGSNTSRLTCQTTGKYLIIGQVEFASNATGRRIVLIKLNGTTTIAEVEPPASTATSAPTGISIQTIYSLTAADYVELAVYQNSGGNLDVNATANYSPEFMMQKIG